MDDRFLQSALGWFKGRFSPASGLTPWPEVPYPVPEPDSGSIVQHSFELQLKAYRFLLLSPTEVITLQQKRGETLPKRSLKLVCQRPQTSLLLNFQQAPEYEHIVFLKTSPFWQKTKMTATTQWVAGDSQVLKGLRHHQAEGQAASRKPRLLVPHQPCWSEEILGYLSESRTAGRDNIIQRILGKRFQFRIASFFVGCFFNCTSGFFSRCRKTR